MRFLACIYEPNPTVSVEVLLQICCRIDWSLRDHPSLFYRSSMEWRSESWMFNDPCDACGTKRLDHDPHHIRHSYRSPILGETAQSTWPSDWEDVTAGSTDPVERAVFRHFEREANGDYDAPLPSPADRKRIRDQAGFTQQEIADRLHVSRDTVLRWEKPAGYRNGRSLPGREPVGELRRAYSELLRGVLPMQSSR